MSLAQKTAPRNVSHPFGFPPSTPRTNQLCRGSADPCVHDSGVTLPWDSLLDAVVPDSGGGSTARR